ncbi:MAG: MBL fold metallo-hydrolase [Solirubrobacteraceae bacterium]
MIFRQILHEDLGCASYFIGDEHAGVAAVVDPRLEIERYLQLAHYLGVRIEHVFETHNHADHVSGHGRLAAATGATIHVHRLVAPAFDHEPFGHGERFTLGALRIEALHTPGHRPEHTCFLLTDTHRGEEPWVVLTGDSLFVGDVARPDLAVERHEGAREIFHSLRERLLTLPDHVEVWPGHLGGSMCGGPGMDMKVSSTIGFERRHNAMLELTDEGQFVEASVGKLGAQPPNFKAIVELNRGPLAGEARSLPRLSAERTVTLIQGDALVVDIRDDAAFAAGHLPGSLWIPLDHSGFGTRLAWLAAEGAPLIFVGAQDADAERAGALAAAVGLAEPAQRGGVLSGGVSAWESAGGTLAKLTRIRVSQLDERLHGSQPVQVLDVRERDEFEAGHIPGSAWTVWHDLRGLPEGLDPEREVAVVCTSSVRAGVAAALLQRHGAAHVSQVVEGGVPRWAALGGELSVGPLALAGSGA